MKVWAGLSPPGGPGAESAAWPAQPLGAPCFPWPARCSHSHPSPPTCAPPGACIATSDLAAPPSTYEGPPDGAGPTAVTRLSLIPGRVSVTTQRPMCRTGDAHQHPQGLPQACVSGPDALMSVHLSVPFIPFLGGPQQLPWTSPSL